MKNSNILILDADMELAGHNLSEGIRKLNTKSFKHIINDCGVDYIG